MFLSSFESDLRIVMYYWNQCTKTIRNLEIVNSFCCANLVRARKKAFGLRSFSLFSLFAFPIRISELGPVQTGRPPPGRGADGSRSLCASSTHARNPAMGPEGENWVPICASNMRPESEA